MVEFANLLALCGAVGPLVSTSGQNVGMVPFCSLCVSEDWASFEETEDGRRFAVCRSKNHGEEGYVWEPTDERSGRTRGDGLGSELDIWDKLLDCVLSDGAIHSYGEVEDRFIELYPAEAAVVWERYGHRWRDGKRSQNSFSMSAYLAARLSELASEGHLEKTFGPAEGPWSYNGVISHWQRV